MAGHVHSVSHHIRTDICPGGGSVGCTCHFCQCCLFSASPPWPLPWSGPGSATCPPLTQFTKTDRVPIGGADIPLANLAVARPLQALWVWYACSCASGFLVMVISLRPLPFVAPSSTTDTPRIDRGLPVRLAQPCPERRVCA